MIKVRFYIFSALLFLSVSFFSSFKCEAQNQAEKNYKLIVAAYEGNIDSVLRLLLDSANVNTKTTQEGVTPLMYAAERGHTDIVKVLLYNKANPNLAPKSGRTALISAAINNHPEIVYNLLLYGAEINATDTNRASALHYSCLYNLDYMAQYLLENGAEPDLKTSDSSTALIYATLNGNLAQVKKLIEYGADINHTDCSGFSATSVAVQNNDPVIFDSLTFRLAGNINELNISGIKMSLMDYAKIINSRDLIRPLRKRGLKSSARPYFDKISVQFIPGVFSINDYFMGFSAGIIESKYHFHAEIGFTSRVSRKRVQQSIGNDVTFQLWEKRRNFFLLIDKIIPVNTHNIQVRQGVIIRNKLQYSFGSFEGVNMKANRMLVWMPGVGYYYHYNSLLLKVAYEYAGISSKIKSPHFISVSVGFSFNFRGQQLKKQIDWL